MDAERRAGVRKERGGTCERFGEGRPSLLKKREHAAEADGDLAAFGAGAQFERVQPQPHGGETVHGKEQQDECRYDGKQPDGAHKQPCAERGDRLRQRREGDAERGERLFKGGEDERRKEQKEEKEPRAHQGGIERAAAGSAFARLLLQCFGGEREPARIIPALFRKQAELHGGAGELFAGEGFGKGDARKHGIFQSCGSPCEAARALRGAKQCFGESHPRGKQCS